MRAHSSTQSVNAAAMGERCQSAVGEEEGKRRTPNSTTAATSLRRSFQRFLPPFLLPRLPSHCPQSKKVDGTVSGNSLPLPSILLPVLWRRGGSKKCHPDGTPSSPSFSYSSPFVPVLLSLSRKSPPLKGSRPLPPSLLLLQLSSSDSIHQFRPLLLSDASQVFGSSVALSPSLLCLPLLLLKGGV